jgi:hypothetical protein
VFPPAAYGMFTYAGGLGDLPVGDIAPFSHLLLFHQVEEVYSQHFLFLIHSYTLSVD